VRIISFSKRWDKLQQPEFTTFRFPRKDADRGRDWKLGERVQVYYKSRSPEREFLGEAEITNKELRKIGTAHEQCRPTEEEAIADGFPSLIGFNEYFRDTYGSRIFEEPINKLTLRWRGEEEYKE